MKKAFFGMLFFVCLVVDFREVGTSKQAPKSYPQLRQKNAQISTTKKVKIMLYFGSKRRLAKKQKKLLIAEKLSG